MKRLYLVTYRYRDLTDEDARQLTQATLKEGPAEGLVAQYERLDGKGGYAIYEAPDDAGAEAGFDFVMRYQKWMEFELTPITTFEDAFSVIQRLFA